MLKNFTMREWTIAAAVGFGVGGLLLLWLLSGHLPQVALSLSVSIVIAYALVGGLAWWYLYHRNFQMSVWRGIAAGLAVSMIALPVFWLVAVLINFVFRVEMPLLDRVLNPLEGILYLPSFTLVAWLTVGWASAAVCAFVGGVLAYIHVRSLREPPAKSRFARAVNLIGVILLIGAIFFGVIGLIPASTLGLGAQPNPVNEYAAAIAGLEKIRADERAQPLVEVCQTQWMTHGQKTEKVIVLYHGLSTCPRQFQELGQEFFKRGYNVLIPRFPEHVNISRNTAYMTPTAAQFRAMADTSIDLAHGLGEKVYVMGLSGGGGIASWVAQERSDVERVVSIAPFYGLGLLPSWFSQWATNLLTRIPNIPAPGPSHNDYQYFGMSSRGVGESMRFAQVAREDAAQKKMAAPSFVLITNEADVAVSNSMARQVNENRRARGAQVEEFIFDSSFRLPHDLIDVHNPHQNAALVYPILIELTEGRVPVLPK